jgi:hypothetical protein
MTFGGIELSQLARERSGAVELACLAPRPANLVRDRGALLLLAGHGFTMTLIASRSFIAR